MKVLVIETAFLGDVIVSLALAEELRRLEPAAEIYYLTRPEAKTIVESCAAVDRALTFDKRGEESGRTGILKKAESLNRIGFDTVYLLHNSRRSQELCRQIKASKKIGFTGTGHAGLTHSINDSGWRNRYERAILPLQTLYSNVDLEALPRISGEVPDVVQQFVTRFPKTIALAPGSLWATKRWGADRYAKLARLCTDESFGIVAIGSAAEVVAARRISTECAEGTVLSTCGSLSIVESAAALSVCNLLVTNDSAPAHLAIAVGTPTLTVLGPTVTDFGFAPISSKNQVAEISGMWCRPCTSHGSETCPIYTHACMTEIEPEAVFQTLLQMVMA